MKAGTDLFHLIKSMDANERGYFKRILKVHSASKDLFYTDLFEKISRSYIYDEKEIKVAIKEPALKKNLPFHKNYLTNKLLDSLASYHIKAIPEINILRETEKVEVLYRRGLLHHCKKKIKTLSRKVETLENWDVLHRLLLIRLRIERKIGFKDFSNFVEYFDQELLRIEKNQANFFRLEMLFSKLLVAISNKGVSGDEIEKKQINSLRNDPVFEIPPKTLSPFSRILYFASKALIEVANDEISLAIQYYKHLLDVYEEETEFKKLKYQQFINVCITYLHFCMAEDNFEEFERIQQQINLKKVKAFGNRQKIALLLSSGLLNYHLTKGERSSALSVAANLYDRVKSEKVRSSKDNWRVMNLAASTHFIDRNFSEFINYRNLLRSWPKNEDSRYSLVIPELLFVISHYELGNFDLLDNLLTAFRRFISKVPEWAPFGKKLARLFKKFFHSMAAEERQQLLLKIKETFIAEMKKIEVNFTGASVLYVWIISQSEGRDMWDILKKGEYKFN